jgi:hypothetical protein
VYFEGNAGNTGIRALANTVDPPWESGNYDVAVNNVQLQRLTSAGWRYVRGSRGGEWDGWHEVHDIGHGRGRACVSRATYRAAAYFQWRPRPDSTRVRCRMALQQDLEPVLSR